MLAQDPPDMSHRGAVSGVEVELNDRVRLADSIGHQSSDMVFALDPESCILCVNEAAVATLGYAEHDLMGMPFDRLLVGNSLAESGSRFETHLVTISGDLVRVEIRKDHRIITARDLAELESLEENLAQSHKMEALGVLAGGIAHDFNNLLTGILGCAYVLQNNSSMPDHGGEALEVIIQSSERAAQLTTQLLSFVRKGKAALGPVDLHDTIREILQLLSRTIDKRIRITHRLDAASSEVLGEPGQIYQVLLNLCLNARDAMAHGGDLCVSTRNIGGSIVVSVSDTGSGIPAELHKRIFEPFFTTKSADRGTGMGLALVSVIARDHGGSVTFDTETGRGSVFHVTLPVYRAKAVAS
jgi:PAS domain S-box-containing protein